MTDRDESGQDHDWATFQPIYAAQIAPKLRELEEKRTQRRSEAYRRALISAVLALALSAVAYLLGEPLAWRTVLVVAVFVLSGLAGFIWSAAPASRHREEVRQVVVPPLSAFLGGLEYHRKPKDSGIDRFETAGVVGSHSRRSSEDLFIGRHRDTGFRMVEARLRRRSGKGTREVFRGLLLDIEVPLDFAGTTLMVRDHGSLVGGIADFVRKTFTAMERITLDHPDFEARYQVYSNDPAEARRLLARPFLDTMVSLADQAGKTALNGAFHDGRFLLALPVRRDLFEIGKLHHALDRFEDDVRTLLEQFTIPHRLIDHLHGDRPELLPRD
jgi:hypothetical protein